MNIFVYADESGVFDKKHEKYFVFGGLIFLDKEQRNVMARKYIHAELCIKESGNYSVQEELKASKVSNKEKGKLFRSLNQVHKFAVVIHQENVRDTIYNNKKSKQRYLDYVFKIGLKRSFQKLNDLGQLSLDDIDNIYVCVDEHTTATDGLYELRESLQEEFKYGTHNFEYNKFFPPLCPNVKSVELKYCNSSTVTLIRGADIVANKVYYMANSRKLAEIQDKILLTIQP